MKRTHPLTLTLLACLLTAPLAAQFGHPVHGGPNTVPPNQQGRHPRNQQCLQQAGVSQAAMQQARSIRERAKAQIEAICANSSLTRQQKQEQIRQIHQQTQQEVNGLVSQAQQEKLRACQRGGGGGRAGGFGGGHGGFGGGQGPCGSFPGDHFENEGLEGVENPAERGR